MHPLVQTYGKQFMKELLDKIIIDGKIPGDKAIDLLKRHGIVGKTTKVIIANIYKDWDNQYRIAFFNGRNQTKLRMAFHESEIPKILEAINNETDKVDE